MKAIFYGADARLRSGWKAALFILTAIAFIGAIGMLAQLIPPQYKAFKNAVPAIGVLLATFICVRVEKSTMADAGYRLDGRFLLQFAAGTMMGIALLLIAGAAVWSLDGFHLERVSSDYGIVAASAAFMLCVGIFEETAFHGFAFQRVVRNIGPLKAQLIFAIAFAAVHMGNPGMHGMTLVMGVINIFLAGLMLGLCYLRTGSLALPIGVHMGWNWMQGTLGFGVSGTTSSGWWKPVFHGQPQWLTGGTFGLEASAAGVVVLALTVLALARWKGSAGAIGAPQPAAALA
ncbi:MAG: type II CAAX endopeptidase family protein [Pseudomonadota bacterium]